MNVIKSSLLFLCPVVSLLLAWVIYDSYATGKSLLIPVVAILGILFFSWSFINALRFGTKERTVFVAAVADNPGDNSKSIKIRLSDGTTMTGSVPGNTVISKGDTVRVRLVTDCRGTIFVLQEGKA